MTITIARPSGFDPSETSLGDPNRVPRDGRDRPLVVPIGGGKPKAHTRMTTFIDCMDDKTNLGDYGQRMVLVGAAKQPSLLGRVRELDPEDGDDKRQLNGIAERAKDIAGANDKREHGTRLHDLSEYVDRGEALPACTDSDLADMAAYKMATIMFDMLCVERFIVTEELGAAGTTDRIGYYAGKTPDGKPAGNLIIDLKTGSIEYGALKMAMQLAGYSRGKFYDHTKFPVDANSKDAIKAWKKREYTAEEAAKAYSDLPGVNQDWGIIVHLPAGTATCAVYWAPLGLGWAANLLATQVRATRSKGNKCLVPFDQTLTVADITSPELASLGSGV